MHAQARLLWQPRPHRIALHIAILSRQQVPHGLRRHQQLRVHAVPEQHAVAQGLYEQLALHGQGRVPRLRRKNLHVVLPRQQVPHGQLRRHEQLRLPAVPE